VDDSRRAASYYQQAIDIDPDFAEAWAGLSRALNAVGQRNEQTRQHFHEPALHAAERAIALDPKLADAHVALAAVRYWLEWDWASANTEYERARSLDPDNSYALNGVGRVAAIHGRLADALRFWEQAAARDPLNLEPIAQSGLAYYAMGGFTEALTAVRKALELVPSAAGGHAMLAQILLAAGRKDEALAEIKKESDAGFRAYGLARIYFVLGRRGDADKALAEVENNFAAEQPYNIATLHALRGERDLAFSWLNRAYKQRDATLIGIPPFTVDPDTSNLHADPRWAAFLHKINLP
jgi:tetratricopeptide (TPR) repeat protein